MSAPDHLAPEDLDVHAFWHLLEAASDGVYRWNAETDTVAWSPQLHGVLGPVAEGRSRLADVQMLIHPDDRAEHDRVLLASRQAGEVHQIEMRLRRADGAWRWFEVYGAWLPAEGPPTTLIGYVRDVHERAAARVALERSEARFRTFFDLCPAAVYLKDRESRHLYGNAKAAHYVGVSVDALIGGAMQDLFDEATAAKLRRVDQAVLQTGEPQTWTGEVTTRSGEKRVLHDVKFPVADLRTGERLIGGFGVDITEERRSQEQLRAMQRLESLGLIAGGIAHDFNNLLAAIQGYAELARQPPPARAADALDELTTTVAHASQLCSQLLAYAGHRVGAARSVDVRELVASSRSLLEMSIRGRGRLRLALDGPARVAIEPSQVQQVVLNLVLNASQASSGGEIVVESALEAEPPALEGHVQSWLDEAAAARGLVRLSVSDAGEGMSEDVLHKVFEPFFTTREDGHGLGLAAVHGIVRAAGGALAVRSTPGQGTRFDVYFPTAEAIPPRARPAAPRPSTPPTTAPWHGRALVVDDQPRVATVACRLLEQTGLTVEVAHSGPSALASWEAHASFDVTIVDVTMPGMGGAELLQELRRRAPSARVVLCSGFAVDDVEHLLDARTTFLRKPFSRAELLEAVGRVMGWPVAPD